jgi:uncharacterized protein
MKPLVSVSTPFLALAGGVALLGQENKSSLKGAPKMFKAVIHVNFSESERQKHGLKNVANMLKEVKENFEIEVVCHGSGIGLLVKDQTQHAAEVERLSKAGVRFAACENTMRDKSISKDNLLPGVVTVPSGAVEIIRKQQEGYGYFRP